MWTWTDGDSQVEETYTEYPAGSGKWRLAGQADTNGNTISFTYDGNGRVQSKMCPGCISSAGANSL